MTTTSAVQDWDAATAAPAVISQLEQSTAWMGSDMAAVARLFVEQQNAQSWWTRTHPRRGGADVTEMLTGWLPYAYGVTPGTPRRTEDGLSMAAQLVRDMLQARVHAFTSMPIYLAGPNVADTVIMLAGTHTYRGESVADGVGIGRSGHLVLPTPIIRRQPSQFDQVVDYVLQQDPVPDAVQAISWTVDTTESGHTLRVGDWILVGEVGDPNGSNIERQVAEVMCDPATDGLMPEVMWSSEWSQPLARPTADTRLSAADRMRCAVGDLKSGNVAPWTRGDIYDDIDGLLSVRLVQVLSDAAAVGLLSATPVAVDGANREVFLLSAAS
ncbi:hypothetical protein [Prescottella subtropica]|uniref:hypothetical protein n=1 Tax=Prescottella subtropica TaxID=2545757 RepID=UPI0010F70DAB|nr:hypothetical protein [Prescottella subtropica]